MPNSDAAPALQQPAHTPLMKQFFAAKAVQSYLEGLAATGEVPADTEARSMPFAAFNDLIGVNEQVALGDRYAS